MIFDNFVTEITALEKLGFTQDHKENKRWIMYKGWKVDKYVIKPTLFDPYWKLVDDDGVTRYKKANFDKLVEKINHS